MKIIYNNNILAQPSSVIRNVTLITSYYEDDSAERQSEYAYCLESHINNKHIDNIIVLSESYLPNSFYNKKISEFYFGKRPMFSDIVNIVNMHRDNTVCIVPNADIYFDDTLSLLRSMDLTNTFFALNRHESTGGFGEGSDAWIFTPTIQSANMNFYLGWWCCDDRINFELQRTGRKKINPSLYIKAHHKHTSDKRNYNISCRVHGERLLNLHRNNKDELPWENT